MVDCLWIEIFAVGAALVGASALAFGLKIKEGISKDLKHLVKEEMRAPTQAEQRKPLIWIGLALLVCAAILEVYTIKSCDRGVVATVGGNDAPTQSVLVEGHRDVPNELFGITLGGIYDMGGPESNDVGDIPVKELLGTIYTLERQTENITTRFHRHFRPIKEYKGFEYVEWHEDAYGPDSVLSTPFNFDVLPVIPETVKTYEELQSTRFKWEVISITWRQSVGEHPVAWANDLCKTFKADISVEPEVIDSFFYACTFSSGDREFTVSSVWEMYLRFKPEVIAEKEEAVDTIIRKLLVEEIRPYERP